MNSVHYATGSNKLHSSPTNAIKSYSRSSRVDIDFLRPAVAKRKLSSPTPSPTPTKRRRRDSHGCLTEQKRVIIDALNDPAAYRAECSKTNQTASDQLSNLLVGTVDRAEGNSCLILGPQGSGKTHLIERSLSALSTKPIIVRLSGWFQTNDRSALRELARQLQTQTSRVVEGSGALDDEDDMEPDEVPPSSQLHGLISLIPTLERPTVIVLDAFDLFTFHPRQSLLYCLLDTVQSCRTSPENKGIAVIGVTSRLDTMNLLEKRVKSRFSGRILRTSPPNTVDDWAQISKILLSQPLDDNDWNETWNSVIEEFLQDDMTQRILDETLSITRNLRVLSKLLLPAIESLTSPSSNSLVKLLSQSTEGLRLERQNPFLSQLPYPSLALLIAAVHAETAGYAFITFEMLHELFRVQVRTSSAAPVLINGGSIGMLGCDRYVLLGAFEHLITIQVFVPLAAGTGGTAKVFQKYRSTLRREEVKIVIERSGQTNLKKWLSKAQ